MQDPKPQREVDDVRQRTERRDFLRLLSGGMALAGVGVLTSACTTGDSPTSPTPSSSSSSATSSASSSSATSSSSSSSSAASSP